MKKYSYILDRKVSIWERVRFDFKAYSQEEADKLALRIRESKIMPDDADYDMMAETSDYISVKDNYGYSTEELMRYPEEIKIYVNGKE